MARPGDIDPGASTAIIVQDIFGGVAKPSGVKLSVPITIIEDLAAEGTPSNGGAFAVQNPFDSDALVDVALNVTTPSTGAALIDVGVGSGSGTSNDNLVDGGDVGSAAVVLNSYDDGGTNGKARRVLHKKGGTNDWITGTVSADSSGMVGQAIITITPINE